MDSSYALPWDRENTGSLARQAAAEAARRIVEGQLPAGALLREVDLAEWTRMSRTPAREAMLQLEIWGLVTLIPKKGAIVTAHTLKQRQDLLAVRTMVETSAAEALAADPTRAESRLAAMRTSLDTQRAAMSATDTLAFAAADFSFHLGLIHSLENSVIAGICENLGPRLARLTYTVIADRPAQMSTLLHDHEALLGLLEKGDVRTFATHIRTHVAQGHETGPDRVRDPEQNSSPPTVSGENAAKDENTTGNAQ